MKSPISLCLLFCVSTCLAGAALADEVFPEFRHKGFVFSKTPGIGFEEGATRRDPSDVIEVDGVCHVWYSKVVHAELPPHKRSLRASGYVATIWYATSRDRGRTWTEKGEALGRGAEGAFDSFAVFTPNIVRIDGQYFLYYTGVKPTPGQADTFENNSVNDVTAIGVARAESPSGPFVRVSPEPILSVVVPQGEGPERITTFDSYRVDDASIVLRDHDGDGDLEVWLYYKGRDIKHGPHGPGRTMMGLAIAQKPEGPYVRANNGAPILENSHEVLVWPHREGVATYASKSKTVEYAADGIDFVSRPLRTTLVPKPVAPGAFRPDLTEPVAYGGGIAWGIAMRDPGGPCPFLARFDIDLAAPPAPETPRETSLELWYTRPAGKWTEALPVGNGRLGAMVFGRIAEERIQLNEESIWAGSQGAYTDPPDAAEHLARARGLFFEGKCSEGEAVMQKGVMSPRLHPRSYQTLGDLRLTLIGDDQDAIESTGGGESYRRGLDLSTAIATTRFEWGGVVFEREVFVSAPDQLLVVRVTSDRPGQISLDARLDRPADATTTADGPNRLVLTGRASHDGKRQGVRFASCVEARLDGGSLSVNDSTLAIRGADGVTFLLAAATDYSRRDPSTPLDGNLVEQCRGALGAAAGKTFSELRRRSVADHQRLFGRVTLDLGRTAAADRPTDERLRDYRVGKDVGAEAEDGGTDLGDPHLAALYFQFGRYLLICSSRPGCLPANLQGIWNEHIAAPWNADYHININVQMNYWPAEVANLSECHEPFFDFIDGVRTRGRRTARTVYGCGGFVAHHTTDAWHYTTPQGHVSWGMWPMAGGWCAEHFMEHYRFTRDRKFLKARAWPVLREAAEFFLDWLVEEPGTDRLVSGPSTSPENKYIASDGKRVSLSMGCAMDQQIIWQTFTSCLEAAELLGIDDAFRERILSARERLARPAIGPDGRILEWRGPYEEAEPGHRHMSHLFGLHPGSQYTERSAPAMIAAARKSIEHRLAHGGGHTGWSRAWIINFWARLKDAEMAHRNVQLLIKKSTLPNLFDNHPPFQIDGNFGGAAGIAEMLLQSHADGVELLPALPAAWPDGSVTGLCARGGYEIDIAWKEGELVAATIRPKEDGSIPLRYAGHEVLIEAAAGKTYCVDRTLGVTEKKE